MNKIACVNENTASSGGTMLHSGGTLSGHRRLRWHPLITLIAVLGLVAGCMAGYGRIDANPNVADRFSNAAATSGARYFIHGTPQKSSAVAVLAAGYGMDSKLWQTADAKTAGEVIASQGWGWRGYDILDEKGATIGQMMTQVQDVTVKVDSQSRVVMLALRFKFGGK